MENDFESRGDLSHRRGRIVATVRDAAGRPVAHEPVTVEQRQHAFGFGNIGFDLIDHAAGIRDGGSDSTFGGAPAEDAPVLAPLWLRLFNQVTLPFYWRGFEPTPGSPDTDRLRAAAQWFRDHGVRVKGHPLLWHTLAPEWLLDLTDAQVEERIRARIRREAGNFAGLVDQWDAINESVILPVFTAEDNAVTRLARSKGRIEMVRMAFEEARAADPDARLVLNDFDLSADYERVIAECLDAGIQIDAIGVQTHMHQGFRGEDEIWEIIERFARFGLPVQLTEATLVSGELMPRHIVDLNDYQVDEWPSTPAGEARQAGEVARLYRTAFAHPAVESLTYWGLTDRGSWLGAPCGLVRADGTPKPAYDALIDLVRGAWWLPPTTVATDERGVIELSGFAGEYLVASAHSSATVTLGRGETREVDLAH